MVDPGVSCHNYRWRRMYFSYFYPVGLDIKRHQPARLSYLFIGVMLLVFAWQRWLPNLLPVHPWDLIFYVGNGQPWTALSTLFLHASWLHLLGNLVYLWAFMPGLEERVGKVALFMLFMITGLSGNLAHGLAAWQGFLGQGGLGILGASGAISGLLGFSLIRVPYARVAVAYWIFAPTMGQNRAGRAHVALPLVVLLWLALQVVNAMLASETGSQVSYPAHLGGFAMGLVLALALGGWRDGRIEGRLATARRYLNKGEGWAAAGSYTEYLDDQPGDLEVRIELARAQAMTGELKQAESSYRDAYRAAVADGRWDLALEVVAEGRRCQAGLSLSVDELALAAHHADKIGNRDLAAKLLMDLVARNTPHPAKDRAWVRLVMLLHADDDRAEEAALWLEKARQDLRPGAWREYLDKEFSRGSAPREGAESDPAVTHVGPES